MKVRRNDTVQAHVNETILEKPNCMEKKLITEARENKTDLSEACTPNENAKRNGERERERQASSDGSLSPLQGRHASMLGMRKGDGERARVSFIYPRKRRSQ